MAQAEQPEDLFANESKGKRFTFEGRNLNAGQIVRDEVAAKDEEEACKKLQCRNIRPLHVSKVKSTRRKRITQKDVTVFTRQLATMIKAGLPLMQAFKAMARDHPNPSTAQILMQVHADVEQGSALGKSFSKCPRYFDRFYRNLVSASETGGILEGPLDKLAVYKEKAQAIKEKAKVALTYPIVIVVVAAALIFAMMMSVLPTFGEVYSSMGAELPGLTQIVMSVSKFFVKYGWVMIVAIILAGFGLYKLHRKSPVF